MSEPDDYRDYPDDHEYDVDDYYPEHTTYQGDYPNERAREPFEPWEYSEMFRPRLIRELQRQVVAHRNLIRLRLYLYSNIDGHAKAGKVELFWIKYRALLREAVAEGRVELFPDDKDWFILPGTLGKAREVYPEKSEVYYRWRELAGNLNVGQHLEKLIRESLRRTGYKVADKAVTVEWNNHKLELDVTTFGPLKLAVEAKNVFSEVYHSPDVLRYEGITDDLKQIQNIFQFCSVNGIIPILAASLVDRTFYGFQHKHKGLHYCIRFQVFPPGGKWQEICDKVREHLRLGNVQVWEEPPPHMQRWFNSLATYHKNRYGTPPPS